MITNRIFCIRSVSWRYRVTKTGLYSIVLRCAQQNRCKNDFVSYTHNTETIVIDLYKCTMFLICLWLIMVWLVETHKLFISCTGWKLRHCILFVTPCVTYIFYSNMKLITYRSWRIKGIEENAIMFTFLALICTRY